MNNIEQIVKDLNNRLILLEKYLCYARDPETIQSLEDDIAATNAQLDIWTSFLS